MSTGDKARELLVSAQLKAQTGVLLFITHLIRFLSGGLLALTIGLIFQELVGFGTLSLLFITIGILSLFIKWTQSWGIAKLLVFSLVWVLSAKLIQLYILIAP